MDALEEIMAQAQSRRVARGKPRRKREVKPTPTLPAAPQQVNLNFYFTQGGQPITVPVQEPGLMRKALDAVMARVLGPVTGL